jgi:hypothetical protein
MSIVPVVNYQFISMYLEPTGVVYEFLKTVLVAIASLVSGYNAFANPYIPSLKECPDYRLVD